VLVVVLIPNLVGERGMRAGASFLKKPPVLSRLPYAIVESFVSALSPQVLCKRMLVAGSGVTINAKAGTPRGALSRSRGLKFGALLKPGFEDGSP
jgi:hypothetical protein